MSSASASRKVALLTGGAGFLGYHLTQKLLSEGYFVISVDNYCTGHRNNVAAFQGNPNYFFLQHDVSLPIPRDAHELMNQVSPPSSTTLFPVFLPSALLFASRSLGQRNLQHGLSRFTPPLPA
jgi:UDP-glucuronate decarboxylase